MRTKMWTAAIAGTAAILVLMIATIGAQTRPAPQAPPRRAPAAPRSSPPPRGETSEPTQTKEAPPAAKAATEQPKTAANATPSDVGAALYKKNGCYECHVNDAQGGPQGPRLGPNPIPMPRFLAYVRNPAGDMPPFTAKVISDQDLIAIYAFLQSRPVPPPVVNIPLLAP